MKSNFIFVLTLLWMWATNKNALKYWIFEIIIELVLCFDNVTLQLPIEVYWPNTNIWNNEEHNIENRNQITSSNQIIQIKYQIKHHQISNTLGRHPMRIDPSNRRSNCKHSIISLTKRNWLLTNQSLILIITAAAVAQFAFKSLTIPLFECEIIDH